MDRCRRIDRPSVSLSRFELDLLGGAFRSFIKSVTQPSNQVEYPHITSSSEEDAKKNLAFHLQLSCFVGVVGFGFKQNLDRCLGRAQIGVLRSGFRLCCVRGTESTLMHLAGGSTASVGITGPLAVRESRAGHNAPHAMRAAGSITG